jgi:hypothetical protein
VEFFSTGERHHEIREEKEDADSGDVFADSRDRFRRPDGKEHPAVVEGGSAAASADAGQVCERLKAGIFNLLEADSRKEFVPTGGTKTWSVSAARGKGKIAPASQSTDPTEFELVLRSIMAPATNGKTALHHK